MQGRYSTKRETGDLLFPDHDTCGVYIVSGEGYLIVGGRKYTESGDEVIDINLNEGLVEMDGGEVTVIWIRREL